MGDGVRVERPTLQAAQSTAVALARSITVGTLSGFLAGAIAGGIGSRVAMRIVAMTAGDAMEGTLTDAEAVVGEITLGGTAFLFFFGGFIGSVGGVAHAGFRPWVADAGRWRGVVCGALLLSLFGWVFVEGDNPDFRLLGEPLLNVLMFALIFVVFGLLLAPLYDWIARVLPRPSRWRRYGPALLPVDFSLLKLGSLAAHALSLLIAAQLFLAVSIAGFGDEDASFIRGVGAYVLVVPAISWALLARAGGGFRRLSDLRRRPRAMAAALGVLAMPVVAGLALDGRALAGIL